MSISAITYFSVVNTLKPRMVVIHSYLAFYIKLIPIVFFGLIAIILLGMNYDKVASSSQQLYSLSASGFMKPNSGNINSYLYTNPMLMYGPEIGFFLSLPAMFFAYDGFYYVTSIKSQLKDPKKCPNIVVLGILCVVIISILITISLLLSTDVHDGNRGTLLGIKYLSSNHA
ncbi:amino acid permease [bacterium]|nr:amino acid permease [bacterium]